MIVITTNNGKSHLERLLNELNNLDLLNHKVLVVDSGTNDTESLNYLDYLNQQAEKYISDNLLKVENNILKTTKKGKFLCDGIASDLFLLNLE